MVELIRNWLSQRQHQRRQYYQCQVYQADRIQMRSTTTLDIQRINRPFWFTIMLNQSMDIIWMIKRIYRQWQHIGQYIQVHHQPQFYLQQAPQLTFRVQQPLNRLYRVQVHYQCRPNTSCHRTVLLAMIRQSFELNHIQRIQRQLLHIPLNKSMSSSNHIHLPFP